MKEYQAKSKESTLTVIPADVFPGIMVIMKAHWQIEEVAIIIGEKEVARLIRFLSDYLLNTKPSMEKTIFELAEDFQESIQAGASQSDILQMLEDYRLKELKDFSAWLYGGIDSVISAGVLSDYLNSKTETT
jgi:hypothetical protein